MSSRPSPWLIGLVGVLTVCCCCIGTGGTGVIAWALGVPVGPAASDSAPSTSLGSVEDAPSRTPDVAAIHTPTPPPLNVSSRTTPVPGGPLPTVLKAEAYNILVPTPQTPSMAYPVIFASSLKTVMYQITGATVPEISRALNANAIPDPHEINARYYAQTDWNITAHWYWHQTLRGCEVERGDVTLAMTVTVPVLSALNAAPDVQNRWSTFIDNTIAHESGHAKLDLDGAREYQRALGNYPPTAGCDSLQAGLRALFDSSFTAIDRANVDYDRQTQHGRKQGAVFP